jgi:nucleoside 2-deoxyribosyltransferase
MVDFISKRLQVFVSSTYNDLLAERQASVEAILSAGHIPAGMELFAAGSESQMEVINQWIDESDVYLLILGGRYGSIEPKSGKSYTQLEYEYALGKGKPLFACVITGSALDARLKLHGKEVIDQHGEKLEKFRSLVQSNIVEFWDDSKDIKLAIVKKLGQLARREDLIGWVRPHQEANLPALSDEIARLSKENAELRSQISEKPEVIINGLPYSQLKELLQRKGIWDFVKEHRAEIRKGVKGVSEVTALVELGLMVKWRENYDRFLPSDSGLMLLNNIEFEELTAF